jgi:hypothetical protein
MSKLTVKSTRDGYRRSGIAFSRAGVVVDTTLLRPDQVEALETDPQLLVAPYAEPTVDKPVKAAGSDKVAK